MNYLTLADITDVDIRLATEDDKDLPGYDHTYFSNLSMCPRWGIIRYGHHKKMSEGGRSMALEAGSASHEFFAAVRFLELYDQGLREHFDYHGPRVFGDERWPAMADFIIDPEGDEPSEAERLNFCLTALHTSGFYDDPRDKRRTLANIEESCIAYFDKWEFGRRPVWIRDPEDPSSDIGIECGVELVLTFKSSYGTFSFRYTGRVDGVHHRTPTDKSIVIHENKTGARIDSTWVESMRMTHQISGYAVWASVYTHSHCDRGMAIGMAIPLPKSYDYGGIVYEPVARNEHHIHNWLEWCLFCYQIDRQFKGDPMSAPAFTHSCNRYFRPCAFIPLCNAPREEQKDILDEMYHDEWDPLAENRN